MNFDILSEELLEPFNVSTPISESILVGTVCCHCTISIKYKYTMGDLINSDMLDFDVILGIDWLHACYTLVDCKT